MTFRINDGPLAGREGKKVTSRQIRDRLFREAEGNVAIKVTDSNETEAFEVAGRGELQLGVLIEQMRREGFELTIGRPRVLTRTQPRNRRARGADGGGAGRRRRALCRRGGGEAVPPQGRAARHAPLRRRQAAPDLRIPSRGLIGYHGEFLTDTRGTGVMNRLFAGYGPWKGPIEGRRNGSLISTENGEAVHYALFYIQERGTLFVNPGDKVYVGMILGENARGIDLEVNPIKEKKLTNIRAAGKDDAMLLIPPRRMSLEQAIAYIEDDELVEVTPGAIRLRKRFLDPHERKRVRAAHRGSGSPTLSAEDVRAAAPRPVARCSSPPASPRLQRRRPRPPPATRAAEPAAFASNGNTQPPVRRARSRNTSASRRAFQSAVSCSTISLMPATPIASASFWPRVGELLEHVADIDDDAHARIGQRARQYRQHPCHPGDASDPRRPVAQTHWDRR